MLRLRGMRAAAALALSVAGGAAAVSPGEAAGFSDEELLQVLNGFEGRRDQVLARQVTNTFPGPADPETDPGTYAWNKLSFALAALYRNERLPEANQAVIDVRDAYLADGASSIGGEFGFHWRAPLLIRIYEMFHAGSDFHPARLTAEAEEAACALLWAWAKENGRIAHTDTRRTWYLHESENHDAMRDTSSWGAAQILRRVAAYKDRRYDDGSTAGEQYVAWTAFLSEYLRERGRRGLLVEIASNTYSKYTLQCWYNYYDLAEDRTLSHLAGSALDLWWADTAHEWLDGVRGGSKARFARDNQEQGHLDGISALGWFYFGQGQPRNAHPAHMNLATSEYRPPLVVADIALDREGRESYEYRSRRPGLALKPRPSEMETWASTGAYVLDSDFGGIVRYSYVTPDFILGTSLLEKRPKEDWTSISDQNRWHGVIFRGHPDARIFPQATATTSNDRANNEQWSVQSRGTLIVQKLNTSLRAAEMRVYFWPQLPRTEEDGWVFVEADHAYAAVRPVSGGYVWEEFLSNWMRLDNQYSPIIFEVVRKADFEDYAAFREAVKSNPLSFADGVLTYTGLSGSGELSFYAGSGAPPEIEGEPVDYAPDLTYDSPFIQGGWPTGRVDIRKDGRRLVLDFDWTDFAAERNEEERVSVTPNEGNGANAFVFGDPDRRDDNFPSLSVKHFSGASASRKAYLRFDLSAVDLPAVLADAELRLTLADFSPNFASWTFNVYGLRQGAVPAGGEVGEDWQETGLTWNNAPANHRARGGGSSYREQGGITGAALFLGTFALPSGHTAGDEVIFRGGAVLRSYLQRAMAGSGLATLMITREESGSANFIFGARDSVSPPELRLFSEGKPERERPRVEVEISRESDFGRMAGAFELLLDRPVDRDLTVYFALDGTADPERDYFAFPEQWVIPAGMTRASISVERKPEALFLEDKTVRLRLGDSFAYETGEAPTRVFQLQAVPMDRWRAEHFSPEQLADPEISAVMAAPNGDGLPNLLKYALGVAPFSATRERLPLATIEDGHLTLTYLRPDGTDDLLYQVQVSEDLANWFDGSEHVTLTATAQEEGVLVTARPALEIGETSRRLFLRLRVSQK